MNSRRFLSAVVTASVLAAFAAPAVQAADSTSQMPPSQMPMSAQQKAGRMAEHMDDQRADQIAGSMAKTTPENAQEMPGHVMMPLSPYEQTARTLTPTELCKRYERRFDAAVKSNQTAEFIDEARTLRIEGGALCRSGDHARGVHKLREALDQIGVDSGLE